MYTSTIGGWRTGLLVAVMLGFAATASAQTRSVTLTLNAATIPDTTSLDSFMEVRGAVKAVAPITLADGNVIDWSDASTLEPANVGGDYWRLTFEIADTTELTFKFYNDQVQQLPTFDGWEADPNPVIPPGTADTTLPVHFFESADEYRGASGDRGDYTWRPYEAKEDSIAIWFRVYMRTVAAGSAYDRENPDLEVAVRGDELGGPGPLSWGANQIILTPESAVENTPGYDLFSGVAYYPDSLAGRTQPYKFMLGETFEGGSDRTFTVPSSDSTLRWVYFSNSPPAPSDSEPVQSEVIFTVDLDPLEQIGIFRKSRGDTVEVRGSFQEPTFTCVPPGDDCLLVEVPGTNQFERAIPITQYADTPLEYKFYLNFNDAEFEAEFGMPPPSGWEEGINTGNNRGVTFEGTTTQDLGVQYFNDIQAGNLIPDGVSIDVHFAVDMDSTTDVQPFAAGDSVFIELNDPIWSFLAGYHTTINGGDRPDLVGVLTDTDADNIYTGTVTVEGPIYSLLTFKYGYGQRTAGVFAGVVEAGLFGGSATGRNRVHFIRANSDGSWPTEWTLPAHTFQATGPLPFSTNPVGAEQVGSELPETVTLLANYPNPFSQSTTFDYTVTEKTKVSISVYNVIGRKVATVVDGIQPAGTYRATFEAGDLASGTYFYRLEANGRVISRPMILVK